MIFRNDSVVFEIIGGIGNQLFGLSAAAYFEEVHHVPVRISLREIDHGITAHGVSIADLELPFQFIEKTFKKRHLSKLVRRIVFKCDKIKKHESFFSRKMFGLYRSNVVGYDEFLDHKIKLRRVQGYFQSNLYAMSLKKRHRVMPFELKSESAWLTSMKLRAYSEKPIMLHVRRGDYRNQTSDFGLLGPRYYKDAMLLLRESFPSNPIWVFTDEIKESQKEFTGQLSGQILWVSPPRSSNAVESFVLMQYGAAHVISNSTFSWWAAYASNTSSKVVAPKPWMKSVKEPKTLIPPDWARIKSDWI